MPILQVKDASYTYPGCKQPTLINVDLCIPADARIALAGCNGAGKSTLVNLMLGRLQPTVGEICRHRNAKIAHLNQHEADELQSMSCTALQYMQECFPGRRDVELRALLGSFGVKGSLVHQSLNTLSGGQRVRVVFAKICEAKPHLLILDEPTNHLDIYSIDALTDALQKFEGAVVLVSHNCSMLNECANELFVIENSVCRAASCPVGHKLGDWLIQSHLNIHAEGGTANASRNSVEASTVTTSKKIARHVQPASMICLDKSGSQPPLAQIPTVPTPARGASPFSNVSLPVRDAGPLRATEKEFLRCSKRVREILKLEALQASQQLDTAQAKKLEKKEEAIQDLLSSAQFLPGDSEMLAKNIDMKELLEFQH
jgi:ABC-type Mn2+/Zn2+ transport system ATPase subunit